ncbi:hypothetical protein [Nonlabens ponticola]|uniref:Uncharacterized protein n=1 Tax=Nonlabens ponticola TaxID=2496866 RepID=A0A3S9MZF8_9FLAO|nr:hypothetical protein [Nonlabens ponticola]AZQ44514.1 hypothetical protein EJ995_09760 [Nonlabens ponticola]
MLLNHIEHEFKIIDENGFGVFNVLESDNPNASLKDLLKFGLLKKPYFYSDDQLKIRNDKFKSYFKSFPEESDVIELYGPIIKGSIVESDFIELNYEDYLLKIEEYICYWRNEGWNKLADQLNLFQLYYTQKLALENSKTRKFYFCDAENIAKPRLQKLISYEYFFTIITTHEDSNKIIVINLGRD